MWKTYILQRTYYDFRSFKRISLSVDHCHKTGKVRALLCIPCNTGIGSFHDNIETMKAAITYLYFHL
jgi:hypothetical protein